MQTQKSWSEVRAERRHKRLETVFAACMGIVFVVCAVGMVLQIVALRGCLSR